MLKNTILIFLSFFFWSNLFGQDKKPNVVLIMMDDMGYGDTEPYGMTGIKMNAFNRMSNEGTRFTHYNASQAICTASRASILTGCYPNRLGMTGALLPGDMRALSLEEETIASLLKNAGYATAMFGKWHLGNNRPFWPTSYGFDTFYGIPYSHDIWNRNADGKLITDPTNAKYKWPPLPLIANDKIVDSVNSKEKLEMLLSNFTERSVQFIKQHKSKPFFLYLAHSMPHIPLAPSPRFKGKSELGVFGDQMMEIDWSISEILKVLDQENLTKNTIVIVTSDNGPWLNYGNHAGSSGGLREGKATSWEGGTRVPLWIKWPEKIEAGGLMSDLMVNIDLLPTIVAACGAKLPKKQIDGINFLPYLTGKKKISPREVFFYYYGNKLQGVRYKNWKMVFPHISTSYAIFTLGKDGQGSKLGKPNIPMALYDLAHDPGEAYDVQKKYPEIVSLLNDLAEKARVDMGDELTQREGKNLRRP